MTTCLPSGFAYEIKQPVYLAAASGNGELKLIFSSSSSTKALAPVSYRKLNKELGLHPTTLTVASL